MYTNVTVNFDTTHNNMFASLSFGSVVLYIRTIPFQEQVGVVYSISGVQTVGHTLVNISHSVLPGHLCKQQ